MTQIRDANKKRVCDLSDDKRTAYIRRGDSVTEIRAEKDGTLSVTTRKNAAATIARN